MFYDTSALESEEIQLILHHTCEADPSRNGLPVYYFRICNNDGNTVGWCDFRVGSNEYTHYAGHIGYQVEESYRGHHYAGKAVRLLLGLAKQHGFSQITITCDADNAASRKTCEFAGGKLVEITYVKNVTGLDVEGEMCIYCFDIES